MVLLAGREAGGEPPFLPDPEVGPGGEGRPLKREPLHGALVLAKPPGITSHDAVEGVRKAARERRIGHAGTLDPLATGVLVLLIGRATRLAALLTADEKEYEGTIRLGRATTTDDREGEPLGIPGPLPEEEAIQAAVARFRGALRQVPPVFSAKKRGGVPLHRIARGSAPGTEIAPPPPVDVEVRVFDVRRETPDLLRFLVVCTAGTYVRALARDLGEALGCGAHLDSLRRTRSGAFTLRDAVALEDLRHPEHVRAHCMPLEAIPLGLPDVRCTPTEVERVLHGHPVPLRDPVADALLAAGRARLLAPDGRLLAVADAIFVGQRELRPRIVFPPETG